MKKIFNEWRRYKKNILVEKSGADRELSRDPVDKRDVPLKKMVGKDQKYSIKDYQGFPVIEWARRNNFVVRDMPAEHLEAILGDPGAFGAAFAVVKGGKEFAVKMSKVKSDDDPTALIMNMGIDNERAVIKKFLSIRQSLPEDIKKHIVKFYSPKELGFQDRFKMDGEEYYISVAEMLSPLSKGEKKFFQLTPHVEKNIFWDDSKWGEVEKILINGNTGESLSKRLNYQADMDELNDEYKEKLSNSDSLKDIVDKLMRLHLEAMFKARDQLAPEEIKKLKSIKTVRELLPYWKVVFSKAYRKTSAGSQLYKLLGDIYTTSRGPMYRDAQVKSIVKDNMLETAGGDLFNLMVPKDYGNDNDSKLDSLGPGPLRTFNLAMKGLKKFGITPSDLHSKNVMKRGDDLVVVDVGLFKISS